VIAFLVSKVVSLIEPESNENILLKEAPEQSPTRSRLTKAKRPNVIKILQLLKVHVFRRFSTNTYSPPSKEPADDSIRHNVWKPGVWIRALDQFVYGWLY
jgi:hypothetical protein